MEKTGEVKAGTTPCSRCQRRSVVVRGKHALCARAAQAFDKCAAVPAPRLKSFTTAITDEKE